MESKVRHVDVVNLYTFITHNYTQFALKIVILLFKFVQSLQEFAYYIKMHFSYIQSHSFTVRYKATLAQFGTKPLLHSSVQSHSCTVRYKATLAQFGTKPFLHSSVQSHCCTLRYEATLAQFGTKPLLHISISSLYFFPTHSHHCELSVIFITMAELFLTPNILRKTQPSRTRKVSNTRLTSSALRIWAEIQPLNNLISRCNHHSVLPRPMCGAVTAAADGDPQLRSSLRPDHPDGMQEVAFFANAS
jgi:hypothetical protein